MLHDMEHRWGHELFHHEHSEGHSPQLPAASGESRSAAPQRGSGAHVLDSMLFPCPSVLLKKHLPVMSQEAQCHLHGFAEKVAMDASVEE